MSYQAADAEYNLLVEGIFSKNYVCYTTPDNLLHVRRLPDVTCIDAGHLQNSPGGNTGVTRYETGGMHEDIVDTYFNIDRRTTGDQHYSESDAVKELMTILPIRDMAIITYKNGYVRLKDTKDCVPIREALIKYLTMIDIRSAGFNYTPPPQEDINVLISFLSIINKLHTWLKADSTLSPIEHLSKKHKAPTFDVLLPRTNLCKEMESPTLPFNIGAYRYNDY